MDKISLEKELILLISSSLNGKIGLHLIERISPIIAKYLIRHNVIINKKNKYL